MALHAIDNISDAFSATKGFLVPFERRRWLKLAVVALFLGGGVSFPTVQFNAPGGIDGSPGTEIPSIAPDAMTVLAAIAAVILAVGLLYSLVGAIMEFVFIESLRTGAVSIRRHWSRRWRQGMRLFGFRIAIGLPALAALAGWVGLLAAPIVLDTDPIVPFGTLFVLGLPLVFFVGLLYALVASLTTVFVVPIMIKTDSGVLASWRVLWGSLKANPKQYLVYLGIAFVLTIAIGILVSIVVGLGVLVLLFPLVVLGIAVYLTVSLSSTIGIAVLAVAAGLFLVAVVGLWLLVQVPVLTYLRYYALLVLGDIDESLDLIFERRAAIRE